MGTALTENDVSGQNGYILLYDGLCGFCNGTVRLIIRHDKHGTMKFAALQSPFGRSVLAQHPSLQTIDSLILIDRTDPAREVIHIRSSGALAVAGYLGGVWTLVRIAHIIPRCIRDWIYDRFAQLRYTFFGRYNACPLPPPEIRSRFLE